MITNYYLTVRNINKDRYQKLIEAIDELDLIKYVFDSGYYYEKLREAVFNTWEPQEWRNGHGQMLILSEKCPEMVFELTCHNEFANWRIYYKDGDYEQCDGEVIYAAPVKIQWDNLVPF